MNFWDEKFNQTDFLYGQLPNDFLKEEAHHFKVPSKVLSLGEGEGRNAVYLAGLGHETYCVDSSVVGKEKALKLFEEKGFKTNYQIADLSSYEPPFQFDAIISIWCHLPKDLRKNLHSKINSWIKPGGYYLIEGYTPAQLEYGTGGPKDLSMLYVPSELSEELASFKKLIFKETTRMIHEGTGHHGTSATVQILCQK